MPKTRGPIDFKLRLTVVPVNFLSGKPGKARAERNNAAWICRCDDSVPLVGRCYYQFDDTCYTECSTCGRKFRVLGRRLSPTGGRKTTRVDEFE